MSLHGYLCGTPKGSCFGKAVHGKPLKYHQTKKDLLQCQENHLANLGFKKLGTREWLDPKGGILMLPKNPQKGARIRKGKEGRPMIEYHAVAGSVPKE